MDLATVFYREYVGSYPFKTDHEEAVTRCTLAWLEESHVPQKEILNLLNKFVDKAVITPEDIPESLWENSLTRKGQYYCHYELLLCSPVPVYKKDGSCISFSFYQEVKIRYTLNDLLNYFYRTIPSYSILRNKPLDTSQLRHILKEFGVQKEVQPLDLILFLIDDAAYEHAPVTRPFDLTNNSRLLTQTIDKVVRIRNERHAKGYDRIIHRNYIIEGNAIKWQIRK